MRSKVTEKRARIAAACAALLLGVGVSAFAQERTYEGDIVALDGKANTFTVKATKPGEVMEMAFHVGTSAAIAVEGERPLFGELVKGDHVVVTYVTAGGTHTVHHAERIRSSARELTFAGNVIGVNAKAQTFTVKKTAGGKVEEMQFHVNPGARLYLGGEDVLLTQLRPGDSVTVAYESTDPTTHYAKHVKKRA
jgi:hypothetical protein